MKTKYLISILACCSLSSLAYSVPEQNSSDTQNIRFDELKVACANPARYHNQVAPSNIQISCTEARTKWIPDPKAVVSLPTKKLVITAVISNKYTVSPVSTIMPSEPQATECNQYKQIIETVDAVHTATCETLMAFKGTSEEYCSENIAALREANPEAIKTQDTGKKVSFCSSSKVED